MRGNIACGDAVASCRSESVGQEEHTALRRNRCPAECAREGSALWVHAHRDQADAEQHKAERRTWRHPSVQAGGERTQDLAINIQIDAKAMLREGGEAKH
jgi:hypothetical protein